jgi:uncharacterized membrane protein YhaH (DUF805 family)
LSSSAKSVALNEFRPHGRLTRSGFWLRHVSLVPIGLWLVIAAAETLGGPYDLPVVVAFVLLLISIWGRRLHDRGRSAWWLLATLVPVLGPLFLIVECGLRGTSPAAAKFGPEPGLRGDYVIVGESVEVGRT